ncbi:hypothetical protein [Glycomyces sp. NPDC047010]|uniref:hypothetical protein n=1 Tax=Glycomyces sp. NPDC047010 TaxID=3155023 RepID=UPI0033F6D391
MAQQLSQARDAVAGGPGGTGAQAEPITAEAAEGRIKVTLGADGRFERIKMTLSALKDGPDVLVEELKRAANEALDRHAEETTYTGPVPDQAEMNERMARIQDASLQQFAQMRGEIGDLMDRISRGRRA